MDDRLKVYLQRRGLIPGNLETEEQFLQRVQRAIPCFSPTTGHLADAFDLRPDWVPVDTSGSSLRWGEGACTEIDSLPEGGFWPRILLGRHSWFVSSRAMMDHERVHAIRCGFEEAFHEEVLAWLTLPHRGLRCVGILCSDRLQAVLLGLGLGTLISALVLDWPLLLGWGLAALAFLFWRVVPRLWRFNRAYRACRKLCMKPFQTLLHLSAREIDALGRAPEAFLKEFRETHPFRASFLQTSWVRAMTESS